MVSSDTLSLARMLMIAVVVTLKEKVGEGDSMERAAEKSHKKDTVEERERERERSAKLKEKERGRETHRQNKP